jgi:hypothetical protein
MILRASERIRTVSVSLEEKLDDQGLYLKSLLPDWFAEFLGNGSVIILPQDDFDALPDEVRDEMEVLKR